ncbi:MAG: hypothetical protein OXF11_01745, partial [Deltaproteobacteria bacterium]|nr:hypothetical protein [Deltaproteobacteria bacterium]
MNLTTGACCGREGVRIPRGYVTVAVLVLVALTVLLVRPEAGRASVLPDERGNVRGPGSAQALTQPGSRQRFSPRTEPVTHAPATGRPDFSGVLRVGETLRAVTGGINDRDGLDRTAFSYQWLADDVSIANATSATYTLTAAEQGKRIKLTVSFTDNVGEAESVTSVARGPVVAASVQNQAPTGLPVISGTVQVGYTLTAGTSGIDDGDGLTTGQLSYQWLRDDVPLVGQTGRSYLVETSDVGHNLRVRVYFTDDRGTAETLTSVATVAVPADVPSKGDVRLFGDRVVTAYNGSYWGSVCAVDRDSELRKRIAQVACRQLGRRGGEYREIIGIPPNPVMFEIDCQGTESRLDACTHNFDSDTCDGSDAFGVRCTDDTGPGDSFVKIRGEVRVGSVLTADVDDDYTEDVESVQWFVDSVAVTGETASTYTVRAADLRKRIKVDARIVFGNTRRTYSSPATNPVQPASTTLRLNQPPVGVPLITGDARVARTLTADTSGISDPDGPEELDFGYQWYSNGVAVSGRTASTYTVRAEDEGRRILVWVNHTDARGFENRLRSAETRAVLPSNRLPSGRPEVMGSPKVGNVLTADTSKISDPDGPSTLRFSYQWLGNDQPITGALSATYTLATAQLGQRIKVRVSFTDGAGNAEMLTSPETVTVLAANTANQRPSGTLTMSLSGSWTVNRGSLTVGNVEISDPDGPGDLAAALLLPGSYEWVADDEVAGSGMSFSLTPDVAGKRIILRVSFTDGAGMGETFSSEPGGPAYWRVAATGRPGIGGGPYRVGESLTATTAGIVEPDGIDETSLAYEWFGDGTAIANAIGSTYTLTATEVNKRIKVRVSFTDGAGDSEELTSLEVGPVLAQGTQDQPATGTVTVEGTPRLGRTLTAVTDGVSDADGLSSVRFEFQWLADNVAISGATGRTHGLTDPELGKRISVRVTFNDDGGFPQTITSAQTAAVRSGAAPTGRPEISGVLRVGETLRAVTGGINDRDGLDRTAFVYQWLADDVSIANATSATYTLTAAEQGKRIKLTVSFTDNVGEVESVTSVARGPVVAASVQNQAPTGLPVVSGTVRVGYTLTADTSGIGDADGLNDPRLFYEWLRNDAQLVGQTGRSYLVETSDVGHRLKVRVNFTDDRGTAETLTSVATVAVPADVPSKGDVRLLVDWVVTAYNGSEWGTVCAVDRDSERRERIAQVACRQLGRRDGEYRQVSGTIPVPVMYDIDCQGTETRLDACTHNFDSDNCDGSDAIGVRCTDDTGPGDSLVKIRGEVRVGEVLTAEYRFTDIVTSVGYEWFVDNVVVEGETASTYTVRAANLRKRIKVNARVALGNRRYTYSSPATNPVQPVLVTEVENRAPAGVPVIMGTVALGQRLTVDTTGITDGDGPEELEFSYQWYSGGVAVSGRTLATYV